MATFYVPDDYSSINAAVNDTAVKPGDTIIVKYNASGYNEEVSITKDNLRILAYNADVFLDGNTPTTLSGPAFHVNGCSNVRIEGFKIQDYTQGIKIENSANTIINKCNFINITTTGVNITGTSSNNTITKCEFTTSTGDAIVIGGVSPTYPSNGCNDITKNSINELNGIKITHSHNNNLACNQITGNAFTGISLENANNNHIIRNFIEGAAGHNTHAIYINASNNNNLSRNMIKVDTDAGSTPIDIVDSSGTTLSNNTIEELTT
ncbi:right-handed parallel beta-helix repeat-containing protein [Clostridium ganghwense]|uniref:Right-handed parallel beta-helix repeat-containing protein n=1 Tax=Clostridium ganghwense TaxID=312089 RepID=A0ABT4CT24_9CLOT|nr:right-handed parallel beta-helix repeat-containing protein [Clostridium ganghwense]MCY6372215.1 right-handed parallel beta-helix repeat-containing protein [Clostridium ganghwense]